MNEARICPGSSSAVPSIVKLSLPMSFPWRMKKTSTRLSLRTVADAITSMFSADRCMTFWPSCTLWIAASWSRSTAARSNSSRSAASLMRPLMDLVTRSVRPSMNRTTCSMTSE